ncbi:MAG: hypothetical protein AB7S81_06260 [Bdellovibrionales bacterium]
MTQDDISDDLVEEVVDSESQEPTVSWQDQDDLLRTLWHQKVPQEDIAENLGRSVAAVMTRAARLGLPRRTAPGRKRGYKRTDIPKRAKKKTLVTQTKTKRISTKSPANEIDEDSPEVMMRVCLMCLKKFKSQGRHNRICPTCKGSAEYNTGSSTPDFICEIGK